MKKGQGLSLNVIIIAAIVLIVLIVLWSIFTGRMGKFTEEVSSNTCSRGYKVLANQCPYGAVDPNWKPEKHVKQEEDDTISMRLDTSSEEIVCCLLKE